MDVEPSKAVVFAFGNALAICVTWPSIFVPAG
jgi:hypothetical protein